MNETTIDISEFSQITDITVADGDNLLLSRADGTAAKVSLAALKTVLGRLFASATALSTEATARANADTGLTHLLKGKLESGALAGQHPFVMLGDFETWDDVNEALDTLATDTTAYKYTGRVRFSKTGANCECVMYVLSYQNAVWVQTCSGALSVSGGKLTAGDAFAQYSRRCENGTLGAWTRVHATPAELAAEAARATAAETAILGIANGTSAESVWNMALKVVTFGDEGLIPTVNNLLMDTSKDTHGAYLLRYALTGGNMLLIQGGLNIDNYPTNFARGVTQMVIGNVQVLSSPDTSSTGTTWADAGVPNGISIGYGSLNILCRRRYYTSGAPVITPWREYMAHYASVSNGQNLELTDVMMRPLYKTATAGGVTQKYAVGYNSATGLYSMNGLDDITPEQMMRIYQYSWNMKPAERLFGAAPIRTNYAFRTQWARDGNPDLTSCFYNNKNMETIALSQNDGYPCRPNNLTSAFNSCTSVKVIAPIDMTSITQSAKLTNAFKSCALLETVQIQNLKISGLSFADSPNLSAASVLYLINNAANTSAITVTVNGNTLLYISAGQDEWAGIEEAAAARNITFVA